MSARTRWYIRSLLPGVIVLAGVPVYIAAGNWPAVVLAIAAAIFVVTHTLTRRWDYRLGWYAGRISMHLGVHDIDPEPWDDVPPRARVPRVEYPR